MSGAVIRRVAWGAAIVAAIDWIRLSVQRDGTAQ